MDKRVGFFYKLSLGKDKKKSPTAEVYGFVMWVTSIIAFILFLIYAFVPVPILHSIHFTYYPDKYWACAIPAYACVTYMTAFFANILYIHWKTPPLDSFHSIRDEYSINNEIEQQTNNDRLPPAADLPIEYINKLMYCHPKTGKKNNNPTTRT